MTNAPWVPFCEIGDVVEFVMEVTTTPVDEKAAERIAPGARYITVALVGAGWDLRRVLGQGPDEIRILDSQMHKYVRLTNQ